MKVKYLPRTTVEPLFRLRNLSTSDSSEIRSLGEILPDQSIRILIGTSLPWALGVSEKNLDACRFRKELVLAHFASSIVCERLGEFLWDSFECGGECISYGNRILCGQGNQQREPSGALDQRS